MIEGDWRPAQPLWLMLAYCAAPGAVNAESIRRGLHGGLASAVLVELGAVAGRVLWAGIVLAGTGAVTAYGTLHVGLAAIGAFMLLRASWHALAATIPGTKATRGVCSARPSFVGRPARSASRPVDRARCPEVDISPGHRAARRPWGQGTGGTGGPGAVPEPRSQHVLEHERGTTSSRPKNPTMMRAASHRARVGAGRPICPPRCPYPDMTRRSANS
jgi:hypothetical protein